MMFIYDVIIHNTPHNTCAALLVSSLEPYSRMYSRFCLFSWSIWYRTPRIGYHRQHHLVEFVSDLRLGYIITVCECDNCKIPINKQHCNWNSMRDLVTWWIRWLALYKPPPIVNNPPTCTADTRIWMLTPSTHLPNKCLPCALRNLGANM